MVPHLAGPGEFRASAGDILQYVELPQLRVAEGSGRDLASEVPRSWDSSEKRPRRDSSRRRAVILQGNRGPRRNTKASSEHDLDCRHHHHPRRRAFPHCLLFSASHHKPATEACCMAFSLEWRGQLEICPMGSLERSSSISYRGAWALLCPAGRRFRNQ